VKKGKSICILIEPVVQIDHFEIFSATESTREASTYRIGLEAEWVGNTSQV